MKINYMSDLHFEFSEILPEQAEKGLKGGDVLVLAGDIIPIRALKRAKHFDHFLKVCRERYSEILAVAGNHEYYGCDLADLAVLRQYYDDRGVRLLNNESHTVEVTSDEGEREAVKFFGATFWTDMNKGDPDTMYQVGLGMNDFMVIRNDGEIFHPGAAMALHAETLELMNKAAPRVVISHHAPSERSVPKKYDGDILNYGYYSDIEIPPSVAVWIHGHMHERVGYRGQHECRVVANPRGMPYETPINGFDFGATIVV